MESVKVNDLKPGDGVDLDNVRNIDHVVEAFLQAGAKPGDGFPYRERGEWNYLFWGSDGRLNRTERDLMKRIQRLRHPLLVEQFGSAWKNPCLDSPCLGPGMCDDRGCPCHYAHIPEAADEVNQPSHYKRKSSDVLRAVRSALLEDGDIEDLECIEAMLSHLSTVDQIRGALRANSFKYRWRYEDKDRLKSLRKARWYEDKLEQLEEVVEELN